VGLRNSLTAPPNIEACHVDNNAAEASWTILATCHRPSLGGIRLYEVGIMGGLAHSALKFDHRRCTVIAPGCNPQNGTIQLVVHKTGGKRLYDTCI
jgi:hypothetical protein